MIEASASVNALDSMFEQTFKGEQAQALELISKQAQEQGIHVDRLKGTWASFMVHSGVMVLMQMNPFN